jgi:hypothetical protein
MARHSSRISVRKLRKQLSLASLVSTNPPQTRRHVCTTNDLAILGRSILTSTLIKPAITRRWPKLRTFVSNLLTAVGAPWEIRRFQTPPNNRIVDLYMKFGDLPGYSSLLVLNPDWDVCFSILSFYWSESNYQYPATC